MSSNTPRLIKLLVYSLGLIALVLVSRWVMADEISEVEEISVNKEENSKLVDAKTFIQLEESQKGLFILDVHTPEQTHIKGTDAFIPFDQIDKNLDKLPTDKNTPILVYCRSGGMSPFAIKDLQKAGYNNLYELEGGIDSYRNEVETVFIEPEEYSLGEVIYGEVTEIEFYLRNYTPNKLKIEELSTSCGCTKAFLDEGDSLKPYGTKKVRVTFDPAVHKDDTDLGQLTRTIYITTDNSDFKNLEVSFSANVVKPK